MVGTGGTVLDGTRAPGDQGGTEVLDDGGPDRLARRPSPVRRPCASRRSAPVRRHRRGTVRASGHRPSLPP
jgi:hypothetical protein